MSSELNQTPAILKPDGGDKEMERTKKKTKDSATPKTANGMGCGPSQAVIIPSSERKSHLHPTVFMVGEESFQMLRELGELKFYHLAQYNSDQEEIEDRHRDFAIHLENPLEYVKNENKSQSPEKNQLDKPHEYRTNKLKEKRVATTRVCRVDESVTTETQCSNDLCEAKTSFCSKDLAISQTRFYSAGSPSTSSSKSQTLATRGLPCHSTLRNERISDMLEDPTKFHGTSINMKDVTSTKSHGAKTSPVQTPCTSETNQKTKTFFGRNRVSPKHSQTSDCSTKQTSNKKRAAVGEQLNEKT